MSSTQGLPKRHLMVLAVLERFRVEAERKGDAILAEALEKCSLNMSGGNLYCPMGALLIEDSIRLEKPLGAYLPPPTPPTPFSAAQGVPLDTSTQIRKASEQRDTVLRLLNLLVADAKQRDDKELLETLQACDEITEHHACPLRLMIANAPPVKRT